MNAKSKKKERFINITLLVASIFLSLCLAEGISRIFLDPIDYLKPKLKLYLHIK